MDIYQILWLAVAVFGIIIFYISINNIIYSNTIKHNLMRELSNNKITYSEDDILKHLDYIIDEAIDYYVLMNITPKEIYYISNKIETEMTKDIADVVSSRISPILYNKLSLIYDRNSIGSIIGERVYTKILSFVITYNTANELNNEKQKKNKNK